jgi:hypothetical protein
MLTVLCLADNIRATAAEMECAKAVWLRHECRPGHVCPAHLKAGKVLADC